MVTTFNLASCNILSKTPSFVDYTVKKVVLTGGFDFSTMRGMGKGGRLAGNEMLASSDLPPGKWNYSAYLDSINKSYIELYAPNQYGMKINWYWLHPQSKTSLIAEKSAQLPWYTGVRDTTYQRIPYTPTNQQLESGDWNQAGYSQGIWIQYHLLGKKPYYCSSSLSSRSNSTQWNAEHNVKIGKSYTYIVFCPFRFSDGRDGEFDVTTNFFIENSSQQNSQPLIDSKIAEIDQQLKPIWDSLEVNPKAYQFSQ